MKRLHAISVSLGFANCVFRWAMSRAVEFWLVDGYFPLEMLRGNGGRWYVGVASTWHRLNNRLFAIERDCRYAFNDLLKPAPQRYQQSGEYRLIIALPI